MIFVWAVLKTRLGAVFSAGLIAKSKNFGIESSFREMNKEYFIKLTLVKLLLLCRFLDLHHIVKWTLIFEVFLSVFRTGIKRQLPNKLFLKALLITVNGIQQWALATIRKRLVQWILKSLSKIFREIAANCYFGVTITNIKMNCISLTNPFQYILIQHCYTYSLNRTDRQKWSCLHVELANFFRPKYKFGTFRWASGSKSRRENLLK